MNTQTQSGTHPASSARNVAASTVRKLMNLTHNSMALMGLAIAALVLLLITHADLRLQVEERVLSFLVNRQETRTDVTLVTPDPQAAERATAVEVSALPKAQANVALWLSRKYKVAPEPLSVLVSEAFHLGEKIKIDPTLILAVMAIESRFNPFAQSNHGAQGLMQVMTRVHTDKYEDFGGKLAAFDPVTNLRVGVQVLQDCIRRAGSVEGGLSLYVGAVTVDGSEYVAKVLGEHVRLRDVAQGKRPANDPTTTTNSPAQPSGPAKPALPMSEPPQAVIPVTESAQIINPPTYSQPEQGV